MNLLEVEGLSKVYLRKDGSAQVVLSNINFNIKKGECFTIIGPNGSGKTTLLRILALLEKPTSGKIYFKGEEITALSKKDIINYRRKLSFVRQKPVVLNTSVYKNIVYGLKIRGMDPELIDKKVKEIIEIVGLKGLEDKNARALSGGEMQRVAIAMNFIVEPELYLLDEVSANLDSKNLKLLEQFISKIKDDEDKTIILSTHDKLEAIKFADRIGVLIDGSISQIGHPNEVFTVPKDEFTALFVGYENIFSGKAMIDQKSGLSIIKINDISITASSLVEGDVKVCIRPESIGISKKSPEKVSYRNTFKAIIKEIRDLGNICHLVVKCNNERFLIAITKLSLANLNLAQNSEVYINFKATDVTIL